MSKSKNHSIPTTKKDDDNDFERDEDVDYSNDFIAESIQSEKVSVRTSNKLQAKAQEIEQSGYSEVFEDVNMLSQSNKKNKPIDVVDEESSHKSSSPKGQSSNSGEHAPSPAKEASDVEDKEVSQSTGSVDWQIVL
jgi:hypothetical protein